MHNIKYFWNIDVDDTMIYASPKQAAQMLHNAMAYTQKSPFKYIFLRYAQHRFKSKD